MKNMQLAEINNSSDVSVGLIGGRLPNYAAVEKNDLEE